MTITFQFGALAPRLHEQLGWSEPPEQGSLAYHWQKDHDAIQRLYVREIITETEREKAHKRLIKRIEKESAEAAKNEGIGHD